MQATVLKDKTPLSLSSEQIKDRADRLAIAEYVALRTLANQDGINIQAAHRIGINHLTLRLLTDEKLVMCKQNPCFGDEFLITLAGRSVYQAARHRLGLDKL